MTRIPADIADRIEADIVRELRRGHLVWFSDATEEGFREVRSIEYWTAEPYTYERDLAWDWTTVTYTDGFTEARVRYSTHEIWKSGPCPMVNR